MMERIEKIASSAVPVMAIAAVLYISLSFLDGTAASPGYKMPFSLRPALASISVMLGKRVAQAKPDATGNVAVPVTEGTSTLATAVVSSTAPVASSTTSATSSASRSAVGSAPTYEYVSTYIPKTKGAPDLEVEITDTGIWDGNQFIHADPVNYNQKPAVVFNIRNVGTEMSSQWSFTAQLPAPDGYFRSAIQASLAPGEYAHFVIVFDSLNTVGSNIVSITADQDFMVANDPNRSNNSAIATMNRIY